MDSIVYEFPDRVACDMWTWRYRHSSGRPMPMSEGPWLFG